MTQYKNETFWGLNGERIVIQEYSSSTEMKVYSSSGEILEMGINIVGVWPFVKDGFLHYSTAWMTPEGVVHANDVLPYAIRPTITWKR